MSISFTHLHNLPYWNLSPIRPHSSIQTTLNTLADDPSSPAPVIWLFLPLRVAHLILSPGLLPPFALPRPHSLGQRSYPPLLSLHASCLVSNTTNPLMILHLNLIHHLHLVELIFLLGCPISISVLDNFKAEPIFLFPKEPGNVSPHWKLSSFSILINPALPKSAVSRYAPSYVFSRPELQTLLKDLVEPVI